MPHINLKMFPGRSDEIKQALAKKIATLVEQEIGCADRTLSVSIEDIDSEKWDSEVYGPEIVEKQDILFKKPGYGSLAE